MVTFSNQETEDSTNYYYYSSIFSEFCDKNDGISINKHVGTYAYYLNQLLVMGQQLVDKYTSNIDYISNDKFKYYSRQIRQFFSR